MTLFASTVLLVLAMLFLLALSKSRVDIKSRSRLLLISSRVDEKTDENMTGLRDGYRKSTSNDIFEKVLNSRTNDHT